MAIDYEGDVLGRDTYPDVCCGHDPTADLLPATAPFMQFTPIEVYLDKSNGEEDIFPCESCALIERSIAELSLFGEDHAMGIVALGCDAGHCDYQAGAAAPPAAVPSAGATRATAPSAAAI